MGQPKSSIAATIIVILLMLFTAGSSIFEFAGEKEKSIWLFLKMFSAVVAAALALLQGIIIARNQQNYTDGAQQGYLTMQNSWREVSRKFESALNSNLEMVLISDDKKDGSARMAVDRLLATFAEIVNSVYLEVNKNDLTVTLGVPNDKDDKIIIAELVHEASGRRRGGVYDLPNALQECNSMSLAYRGGRPVYTADAWEIPALLSKNYRSILSIPITSPDWTVIGVLNVDTAEPDAFGPRDPNNAGLATVIALSLPVQRAIAQILLTSPVYSDYRSSSSNP